MYLEENGQHRAAGPLGSEPLGQRQCTNYGTLTEDRDSKVSRRQALRHRRASAPASAAVGAGLPERSRSSQRAEPRCSTDL